MRKRTGTNPGHTSPGVKQFWIRRTDKPTFPSDGAVVGTGPVRVAGPVLGWTSAIAAYGAFIIPKVLGEQIKLTTPENALYGFAVFYGVCIAINWWFYLRKSAEFHNP